MKARECRCNFLKKIGGESRTCDPGETTIDKRRKKRDEGRMESMDKVQTIRIDLTRLDRELRVGAGLSEEMLEELIRFLRGQTNQFAWKGEATIGISSKIIVHRLNLRPQAQPVKQKKRSTGMERNCIIHEEIQRLLGEGIYAR